MSVAIGIVVLLPIGKRQLCKQMVVSVSRYKHHYILRHYNEDQCIQGQHATRRGAVYLTRVLWIYRKELQFTTCHRTHCTAPTEIVNSVSFNASSQDPGLEKFWPIPTWSLSIKPIGSQTYFYKRSCMLYNRLSYAERKPCNWNG